MAVMTPQEHEEFRRLHMASVGTYVDVFSSEAVRAQARAALDDFVDALLVERSKGASEVRKDD